MRRAADTRRCIPDNNVASYLQGWKVYHFHDTSDTAKVKSAYSMHATGRLLPQGENLAAFLYGMRDSDNYQRIVQTIQRVAPFFHDFIFEPEANDLIRLRWKHKGSDDYFDANMLSDGTLRFICMTTLLLQPVLPTMILLDEPELGLHPFAMQLLAAMMRSASKDTQIIACPSRWPTSSIGRTWSWWTRSTTPPTSAVCTKTRWRIGWNSTSLARYGR